MASVQMTQQSNWDSLFYSPNDDSPNVISPLGYSPNSNGPFIGFWANVGLVELWVEWGETP